MALERMFDAIRDGYDAYSAADACLSARVHVRLLRITLLTGYLFYVMPKGFLPSEDVGQLFAFTEAGQDISFDAMYELQQQAAAIIRTDPAVDATMAFIGISVRIQSDHESRPHPDPAQAPRRAPERGRGDAAAAPQAAVHAGDEGLPAESSDHPARRRAHQEPVPVHAAGLGRRRAVPLGADHRGKDPRVAGFQDVTSDLQIKNPQVVLDIDRDKASALGVTAQQIENALYDAYGQRQVSTIYTPTNEYWVILELLPQYQLDPSALSLLYVRSSTGNLVPLGAVAKMTPAVGPLIISHLGQLPAVTISFNLKPGVALGQGIAEVNKLMADLRAPGTLNTSFQGSAQAFQSSLSGMGLLLILAVFVIYLILGILYESFIHPLTILSGLPTAGLGALLTLMLFHIELDMYGFVGLVMLIGIVKKNAIMMIDFAIEAQRKDGRAPTEAIYEAALIRFRPIMMTTMAALMGTLPIALGLGAGAEARMPLASPWWAGCSCPRC